MVRSSLNVTKIKKHLFVILLTILNLSTFLTYIPNTFLNETKGKYIYLSIYINWFLILIVLIFAELLPSLFFLVFLRFLRKKKYLIIVFKTVLVALSIIIFWIHMFIAMISYGPFISHTTDVNNFGKYDETVTNLLDEDGIAQIIKSEEEFTCIKLDYSYYNGMYGNVKIYYTLKFNNSESINAEQMRLDSLMDRDVNNTYNIRLDSHNSSFPYGGFAEITATVDRTCNTIDYFISAEW